MFSFLLQLMLTFLSMWVDSSIYLPFSAGTTNPNIAVGPYHKKGKSLENSEGKNILGRYCCRL